MLEHTVDKKNSNWNHMLFLTLYDYHTSIKTIIGFKPFHFSLYVFETVFPIQWQIPTLELVIELLPYNLALKQRLFTLEHFDEEIWDSV